jgi:TM2 domain-containing membrane protein YozV
MGLPGAGRSRRVAAVLSLILPGLGQMYLGKVGLGFVYLLSTAFCYAAASLLIVDASRTGEPGRNSGIIGAFTLLGLAIPLVSTFGAALARPRNRESSAGPPRRGHENAPPCEGSRAIAARNLIGDLARALDRAATEEDRAPIRQAIADVQGCVDQAGA